jgi:hypothetical protein
MHVGRKDEDMQALPPAELKLGSPDSDRDKRLQRPLCCHYTTPQSIGARRRERRYLIRTATQRSTAPTYWQTVPVLLLPKPGGVQSVSRETCQPESEMSNR